MISTAPFVKANRAFNPEFALVNLAPMFRRRFTVGKFKRAMLSVAGLGYGEVYINGGKVSLGVLAPAVANYDKTVWYDERVITDLLVEGENVVCVFLGNGYLNETFPTVWHYDKNDWRDNPKFILSIDIDGKTVLESDDKWLCKPESAVYFNQMRSGEHFDSRMYDPNWTKIDFDDSSWERAIIDDRPPKGTRRKTPCEPIREIEVFPAKRVFQNAIGQWVFDIGQNISGFVRLKIRQKAGDEIVIRYSEALFEDGTRDSSVDFGHLYPHPDYEYMTDRYICDGEERVWSPRFTYHGFQYVLLEGVRGVPPLDMVSGVYVHNDIKEKSAFECSDEFLNVLFQIGMRANFSNMHSIPTDCPTREKAGWMNDAQASMEQWLIDFKCEDFLKKWYRDILDACRDDGNIPSIVPTGGWGYDYLDGPVSEGTLFELPYQTYMHTADKSLLIEGLPYFKRYFEYYESRVDPETGLADYGLWDWASAPATIDTAFTDETTPTARSERMFLNAVLTTRFARIAALAAKLAGDEDALLAFEKDARRRKDLVIDRFIDSEGRCVINTQTAAAILITQNIYRDKGALEKQLVNTLEDGGYHNLCGMVGTRHLFDALSMCDMPDKALAVLTAHGYPSYRVWVDAGANTLWETWQRGNSRNHHMYSNFMAWLMKNLAGINADPENPGYESVIISPKFVDSIDWVRGSLLSPRGTIEVDWIRRNGSIDIHAEIPNEVKAVLRVCGKPEIELKPGDNDITVRL